MIFNEAAGLGSRCRWRNTSSVGLALSRGWDGRSAPFHGLPVCCRTNASVNVCDSKCVILREERGGEGVLRQHLLSHSCC